MQRTVRAMLVMGAACSGSPARPAQDVAPPAERSGCPGASQVYVVERATETRWRLPLGYERGGFASEAEAEEEDPSVYEERLIDEREARAHGVTAAPPTLWIYAAGAPPCRATAGPAFAHTTNSEGDVETAYGVQLVASCAPGEQETAFALAADAEPSGCAFAAATAFAERRDRVVKAGHRNPTFTWTAPATPVALPPALARGLPAKACAPPACELLYDLARAGAPERPAVWQVTLTWLQVGAPDAYCAWTADEHVGIYVEGDDGAVHLVPQKADRMPPHRLAGVFTDGTRPRIAVLQEAGWYGTYDLDGAGAARAAKDVRWQTPHVMELPSWSGFAPRCDAL